MTTKRRGARLQRKFLQLHYCLLDDVVLFTYHYHKLAFYNLPRKTQPAEYYCLAVLQNDSIISLTSDYLLRFIYNEWSSYSTYKLLLSCK